MQLSEIREEVSIIIQDDYFTDEIIDAYINDVYLSIVAQCLIPELKGIDTVTTVLSQAYTSLTGVVGGFSGVLSRVYNSQQRQLVILPTLETLISLNGNLDDSGDVEAVALEGSILWYYPTPTTPAVLTLVYYKNPEPLTSDNDEPTAIPDFLHRQILVNGASALCFNLVEDGIDGDKINTTSREMSKNDGLRKLREWLGKTRRHYIVSQEPF